jgi:hypothetical protein
MRDHPSEGEVTSAKWPLPLDEHPALELATHFARLSLVPVVPGEAPHLELLGRDAEAARVQIEADGGTTRVRLDGTMGEPWWGGKWWDRGFWDKRGRGKGHRSRLVVHVPPDVHARIRAAAAKVVIERLRGCDLDVATDAGQIQLNDVHGRLQVRTDAGKIEGRGLSGSFDVSADMGAIEIEIDALDPGDHRLSADMGSVRVTLARGLPVRIDARTSMGSQHVEFPSTAGAPSTLAIATDLGAIHVRSSTKVWTPSDAAPEPRAHSAYRTNEITVEGPDADIERVLARVARGTLSPADAREILRGLGVS